MAKRRSRHGRNDGVRAWSGFTIIELLIVIVIIAILAAITIVAYNGVIGKADAASAQSSASQANKAVLAYMAENANQAPTSLAQVHVSNSGQTTYHYRYDNTVTPNTFCITATTANASYFVNNTNHDTPTVGTCLGQDGTTITNLVPNPSAEASLDGMGGPHGTTLALSSAQAIEGRQSVLATLPTSAENTYKGVMFYGGSVSAPLQANTTYTLSAYVYLVSPMPAVQLSAQGAGVATKTCRSSTPSDITTAQGGWVRLSCQFTTGSTTGSSASINLYALNAAPTTSVAQFYLDGIMMTQGTTLYNYADGNAPGWTWSGVANDSISTGPPLQDS